MVNLLTSSSPSIVRGDDHGKADQVFGFVVDITERKKLELAAQASEARYKKYFELGLVGMAIETSTGGWIDVNSRLCEIFGYSRDELFKKHWTEFTHPDDVAKDQELFGSLIRGDIEHYSMEKRFIRKHGTGY